MTDQEKRYRCPGCGNEESGVLIEAVEDAYAKTKVRRLMPWCPVDNCTERLLRYQLIEEPEQEGAQLRRYMCPRCENIQSSELVERAAQAYSGIPERDRPKCPDHACRGSLHDYKPVEEPEGLVDGRYTSIAALEAAQSEPEAEVREWGTYHMDKWHRYPDGHGTSSACGKARISPFDQSNVVLHAKPQGEACPACLPKPMEEPKPKPDNYKITYETDIPVDRCIEHCDPPRAEWVPPEWEHGIGNVIAMNYQALAKSLAEHVNAMLARPTIPIDEDAAIDEMFANAPRRGGRSSIEPEVPWTRVEDGLPDSRDVEVRVRMQFDEDNFWYRDSKWMPTHWRYTP